MKTDSKAKTTTAPATRQLKLSIETLRRLSNDQLNRVAGGVSENGCDSFHGSVCPDHTR